MKNRDKLMIGGGWQERRLCDILSLIGGKYGLDEALVFTDGSFGRKGRLRYVPVYQVMFLEKEVLPETMVYELPPL